MNEKTHAFQHLLQKLDEKCTLLEELLNLTNHQLDFIRNQEIEKLERVIESKQLRITKIENLDLGFTTASDALTKRFGVKSLDELDLDSQYFVKYQEKLSKIRNLIKRLYELDENVRKQSDIAYNEMKLKSQQVQSTKRARNGYNRPSLQSGGIYLNKRR